MYNVIAGIGLSRAIMTSKLLDSGVSIGATVHKYNRPGVYISGGDTRLSIMVKVGDATENACLGYDIQDEIIAWRGVSDIDCRQLDTGTMFIRCTYQP